MHKFYKKKSKKAPLLRKFTKNMSINQKNSANNFEKAMGLKKILEKKSTFNLDLISTKLKKAPEVPSLPLNTLAVTKTRTSPQ